MFNFPVVRRNRDSELLSLDNLFGELFNAPLELGLTGVDALPTVDIYEKDDKLTVRAEIPGVKAEELNVSLEDSLLTISGEKKEENEVKQKDYYRLEAAYGKFARTVRLPETAQAEGAKAEYKNGVLKIELPKAKEVKKNQLKIEVK